MRLHARALAAIAAALTLCSCGGDEQSLPATPSSALAAADQSVAAVLYAGTPRTPPGFFADPAPIATAQVTTYHLKSAQVEMPGVSSYELCADDWSVAFAWSEELAERANPYLDFIANDATDAYFEFDRVPRGQPDRYVRLRVYRCSYLDRTGVDPTAANGPAGVMNRRPIDAAALRELSEYLWSFSPYNNANHAVLASAALPSGLAHSLMLASLERAGVGASCDLVTVREWVHSADPRTGALQHDTTVVREFGVRQENGLLVAC